MLTKEHHQLILWTVREGKFLDDAISWCKERGVDFWAVNKDYPEEKINSNDNYSRKIKADMFIDDRNIGGLPDWGTIDQMIKENKSIHRIYYERMSKNIEPPKKKHWWQV